MLSKIIFLAVGGAFAAEPTIQETCTSNMARVGTQNADFEKYNGKGATYSDIKFPASIQSLSWKSQDNKADKYYSKLYADMQNIKTWIRPSEIEGKTPSLWGSQGIQPLAVNQGAIGNCWFLAVGAALAEWPERITKLFDNSEYSKEGIFRFNFHVKGQPVKVVVDDRIPVISAQDKRPQFASPNSKTGSYWNVIMEKAWSKLNVNYMNTDGGWSSQAFKVMTDMPQMRYQTKDFKPEALHEMIRGYDTEQYPMMGACINEYASLVTGHAYTILGAIILKKDGKDVRLYKMRNPWGTEQYDGPWNDNDTTNWTENLRAQVNLVQDSQDGVFYMDHNDLPKAFPVVEVSLHKNWKVDKVPVQSSTKTEFDWTITNPVEQELAISVDLVTQRMYPPGCDQHTKQTYRLELEDITTGTTIKYVWADAFYGFGNMHFKKMAAGKYKVKVIATEKTAPVGGNAFTLTLYGGTQIIGHDGVVEKTTTKVITKPSSPPTNPVSPGPTFNNGTIDGFVNKTQTYDYDNDWDEDEKDWENENYDGGNYKNQAYNTTDYGDFDFGDEGDWEDGEEW